MKLLERITNIFIKRETSVSSSGPRLVLLDEQIKYSGDYFNSLNLCLKDNAISQRSNGFYKTIKLLKITKIPQQLRERRSLLRIHSEVLSGIWVKNIVFLNIIANIIDNHPGRKGMLFLYGVEGIGVTENLSRDNAEKGYLALQGLLQGNYKQLRFEDLTRGDFLEIYERLNGFRNLMVVRGIPASRSGVGTSAQSELGLGDQNIEELNEEFLRGMIRDEFLLLSISVPVDYNTLNFWLQQTSEKLSLWKSDIEGMKSMSAGISIPFMMIGMLGKQIGNSIQETSSLTESNLTSDSISELLSSGESITSTSGETTINSNTVTEGTTEGHSISSGMNDVIGSNTNYSQGENYSEGNQTNHSDNFQTSFSEGETLNESTSFSRINSQTQHHSVTHSQSMTRSHSETHGTGQNISFNTNWGKNFSQSVSNGQNWQSNTTSINSTTDSNSTSEGFSSSSGKTFYDDFYQTSYSKPPKMQTGVWNSSNGWNAGGGVNLGLDAIGIFGKGGVNKSHGFAEGFRQIDNESFMDFFNGSKEVLSSDQMTNPYKVFVPKDVMGSMSNDIPFGSSYTLYNGNPITQSVGNNITNTIGNAVTKGLNVGNGIGGNLVNTVADGISRNLGITTGLSRQQSVTDGWSVTQGMSETFGTSNTTGTTEGQIQGSSISTTNGTSNGYSDGYSQNTASGYSNNINSGTTINRGSSFSSTFSSGKNQSMSLMNGTSQLNSNSQTHSTQVSNGSSHTNSTGTSLGFLSGIGYNRGVTAGLSSSFGIAPSIMISHSRREYDEGRENLARLYTAQKERLLKSLKTGIFSTATYLMTNDLGISAKAKVLFKSAFVNQELLSPIQVLELNSKEQEYLKEHVRLFSQCSLPEETIHPTETFKFCQTLLPEELAAFNHPPRVEIEGIYTTVENIPDSFTLPGDRLGEIEIGNIISPELGEPSIFRFGLQKEEVVHTSIYGITGSGKTNGALQYIKMLARSFPETNINIFDFKNEWRNLINMLDNQNRFRFFSLYNEELNPLYFNPLRIPEGIEPEEWKDTVVEVFCLENMLGEKQFGILDQALFKLYESRDIFDDLDHAHVLSSKVTLKDLYNLLESEMNGIKGRALIDSYYGILVRLRKFTNIKSKLNRMYCNPRKSIKLESLFNRNYITVFEGQRLDHQTKKFILGLISAAEYKFSLIFPTKEISRIMVFEEAHEIIKGSDTLDNPIKETSIYEKMFMESRGLGTSLVIIAQNISMIPLTVRQNCPNLFVFKLTNEEDLKLVMRSIGRDERIDHRDIIRYIANKGVGYATIKIGNVKDYLRAQPFEVLVDYKEKNQLNDEKLQQIIS